MEYKKPKEECMLKRNGLYEIYVNENKKIG